MKFLIAFFVLLMLTTDFAPAQAARGHTHGHCHGQCH